MWKLKNMGHDLVMVKNPSWRNMGRVNAMLAGEPGPLLLLELSAAPPTCSCLLIILSGVRIQSPQAQEFTGTGEGTQPTLLVSSLSSRP